MITHVHKVELPKKRVATSVAQWLHWATRNNNIRGAHAIVRYGCVCPFYRAEGHALRRSAPPPCAPRLTLTTVAHLPYVRYGYLACGQQGPGPHISVAHYDHVRHGCS